MNTQLIVAIAIAAAFVAVMFMKSRGSGEAKEMIENGALVIDVRSAAEFGGGHLNGAKNIPVDQVQGRLRDIEKWAGDKERAVVVYCASGMRSGRALSLLKQAGFSNVVNGGGYGALR